MTRLWLAIAAAAAILVGTGVIASMTRTQPGPDPVAVISAYEMARNSGDIDTALSYFADNAVITQRNTTFSGKDDIRKYLEGSANRARAIVVSDRHATGSVVSWTERAAIQTNPNVDRSVQGNSAGPVQNAAGGVRVTGQPGGIRIGGGPGQGQAQAQTTLQTPFTLTVDAVVQDGKILSIAYVFGSQAARQDASLSVGSQVPATIGLIAVLGVLLSLLTVSSISLGRRAPVASTLRGRLMQDLQGWAAARD